MYILTDQKCIHCGATYNIVSRFHFRSVNFPWTPFCSKKCDDEHKRNAKNKAGNPRHSVD